MNDDTVRSGKVVEADKPEDNAKSNWRFAPESDSDKRLRLTSIPMHAGQDIYRNEIDLKPYANQKIKVKGNFMDDIWVYEAEVIET